jgi:hypothetical protein
MLLFLDRPPNDTAERAAAAASSEKGLGISRPADRHIAADQPGVEFGREQVGVRCPPY